MGVANDLLRHPRRVWLRRVIFQIHLWAGLLGAAYLLLIALSGSVLVYKDELTRLRLPAGMRRTPGAAEASPQSVVTRFTALEPGGSLNTVQFPSPVLPAYLLEGSDAAGRPVRFFAVASTGSLIPVQRNWLDTVHDFHYYLLLPHTWGMQANAAGAAALLLLALSGILLWWPGIRSGIALLLRGSRVNLGASWRRINYDLHNAIGFWTLSIVAWWALSGVYFGFYRQVSGAIASVSPLRGMQAPVPATLPPASPGGHATLQQLLQAGKTASPQGRVWSISDPLQHSADSYVLLDRGRPGDFSHRDIVRLRNADAQVLSVWRYGERHSLGDLVLWSMHPLHFGTTFGAAGKAIWCALGMSLAVLTITGVLMYWNRFLRHTAFRGPPLRCGMTNKDDYT